MMVRERAAGFENLVARRVFEFGIHVGGPVDALMIESEIEVHGAPV